MSRQDEEVSMIALPPAPPEQRIRLSLIPWETYVAYSDGLGPRRVRVTYDRGEMEIMTLSFEHERYKTLTARLVEALTEEMNIDIVSAARQVRGVSPQDGHERNAAGAFFPRLGARADEPEVGRLTQKRRAPVSPQVCRSPTDSSAARGCALR
jgi:hypothetical protein